MGKTRRRCRDYFGGSVLGKQWQKGSFAGIEGVGGSVHHAEAKPDPCLGSAGRGLDCSSSGCLLCWSRSSTQARVSTTHFLTMMCPTYLVLCVLTVLVSLVLHLLSMQAGPVNSEGAPSAGVGTQVGSGPLEELRGTSGSFTLGVAVEKGLLSRGPQVLFCNLSQLQGEEVHLSFWALGGYTRRWWPFWETPGHPSHCPERPLPGSYHNLYPAACVLSDPPHTRCWDAPHCSCLIIILGSFARQKERRLGGEKKAARSGMKRSKHGPPAALPRSRRCIKCCFLCLLICHVLRRTGWEADSATATWPGHHCAPHT